MTTIGMVTMDSALNSIVRDVDKIKDSAVAALRCFIVEVMGHDCGYLALLSGLATGAEQVYLPEEGISLARLQEDLDALRAGFALGKRLGLVIRGEHAEELYTTSFVEALFSRESGGLFDVRHEKGTVEIQVEAEHIAHPAPIADEEERLTIRSPLRTHLLGRAVRVVRFPNRARVQIQQPDAQGTKAQRADF